MVASISSMTSCSISISLSNSSFIISFNLDLDSFVNYHKVSNNDATIAAVKYTHKVPYGVLEYDVNGTFMGLTEKPDLTRFVSAGIYLLSSKFKKIIGYKCYG